MSDKLFIVKKRVYAKNIAEAIKNEHKGEVEEVWEEKKEQPKQTNAMGFGN